MAAELPITRTIVFSFLEKASPAPRRFVGSAAPVGALRVVRSTTQTSPPDSVGKRVYGPLSDGSVIRG
jgi:hypothetical protein